jgi:alpha-mannosidase
MRHLERYVNRLLKSEANDHTYLMFGCDYAFTAAEVDYENMDRVIQHWNRAYPNVKMLYSTPKEYLKSIEKRNKSVKEPGFKVRRDDGYPYAMKANHFWAGFYSSRPHLKALIRDTSARFHTALSLAAASVRSNELAQRDNGKRVAELQA